MIKCLNIFRIALLLGLFVFGLTAHAQQKISGELIFHDDMRSIPEAVVTINELNVFVTSNLNGKFHFEDIEKGTYTLRVFCEGCKTQLLLVNVDSTDVNLQIKVEMLRQDLNEIIIEAEKDNDFGITRLKQVDGFNIYAAKKNEVIRMEDMQGNLATNNSREIYAKVPGLNIWESDDAGIQLGIGGRGLNPSRVSNFNTRQNGYDISADALGYPESYYAPPTEAIEQIEIVRGAASLQYGTQFGGLLNFKMKRGNTKKPIEILSRQTVGSFGLFNSFNSLGGQKGKLNYYTYYNYKQGDGWRPNSSFEVHNAFSSITYQINRRLSMQLDLTHMNYLNQQPGGLTDAMFEQDASQSFRTRNWFKVNWNMAALIMQYHITDHAKIEWKNFGLIAGRDALGYTGPASRADPFEDRDLLYDRYRNYGSEVRFLQEYLLFKERAVFLIGARYYKGHTERKQGKANNGSGPDFEFLNEDNPEYSDYDFPSENVAVFAEHIFHFSPKFSITPGMRFEYIKTAAEGYYNIANYDLAGNVIYQSSVDDHRNNERSFVLGGIGSSYKFNPSLEVYGNISQNYRSINFNDMRVVNPNFDVDTNLQDEKGFSLDIGFRGNHKDLFNYDFSLFMISYKDRIGEVLMTDSNLFTTYRYRTNVSDSRNIGVETFFQVGINELFGLSTDKHHFSVFNNFSWMHATYVNSDISAYDGNDVELVPEIILKTGLMWKYKDIQSSLQYAYTGSHFTDATNAEFTSNAVNGIIPSYEVVDWSIQGSKGKFTLVFGINNVMNSSYFTRRASGYPGPGIIPSPTRNFYTTLQLKI